MHIGSVLVTGGAGDIGRGVATVLKSIPWLDQVHGMDLEDKFPSSLFYDSFFKAPSVRDVSYLEFLRNTASVIGAELIIPTSEPELRFFVEAQLTEVDGIPLLMPSVDAMNIGFDKHATSNFLKRVGLPSPWTVLATQSGPQDIPCILKSRTGSGSKQVTIITEENYSNIGQPSEDLIFQELLLPDNQEYTCGLFRSRSGEVATISIQRTLSGGRTGQGEVVFHEEIVSLLKSLAQNLQLVGSINVQLRLTERGPVVFEINPRFSSTVTFRHLLGFRDLEWAIQDQFGGLGTLHFDPKLNDGKRIFRGDKEIIY